MQEIIIKKPQLSYTYNPEQLEDVCQAYIDEILSFHKRNKSREQFIYETTMETFFGKDILNWIHDYTKGEMR